MTNQKKKGPWPRGSSVAWCRNLECWFEVCEPGPARGGIKARPWQSEGVWLYSASILRPLTSLARELLRLAR